MVTFRQWFKNWWLDLDEFIGGFFPRSLPGETMSSRAASARNHGHLWGCWLCKFLDFIDSDHCNEALQNDKVRAQAVIDDLNR